MRKSIIVIGVLVIAFLNGCYYDKFNELHPLDGYVNTCDETLPDTYSSVVKNIMLANCTSCHSKSVHNGNIILTSYDQVVIYVNNGKLMGSIEQKSSYKSMPPGTSLRDCDIQQLQKWIDNGMPQ